eukprot:TRINITY_DN9845_c0_g2_i1.p3 TRINITY_DN9845_c0_g2~~TRINITY_DN9845_c0_g2_i1.p3  ORF type:complete len:116 (+),score=9.22 TRINITY_DN9845_c0_g2_i1:151-498(+)
MSVCSSMCDYYDSVVSRPQLMQVRRGGWLDEFPGLLVTSRVVQYAVDGWTSSPVGSHHPCRLWLGVNVVSALMYEHYDAFVSDAVVVRPELVARARRSSRGGGCAVAMSVSASQS